ncbi:DUF309 domain-containing protein [bacterium]|nr:DUF309 domain-containing protein [bacterium]
MSFDDPIEFPAEYLAYFDRFNDRDFFEAHEVLEDLWVVEVGELRDYYKGLIMIAAAFHQWRRGRCRGAYKLFRDGRAYLATYPALYQGFELKGFLAEMDKVFRPLVSRHGQDCPAPSDEQLPWLALVHTAE